MIYTEDLQVLVTTVQYLVATANCCSVFVHSWFVLRQNKPDWTQLQRCRTGFLGLKSVSVPECHPVCMGVKTDAVQRSFYLEGDRLLPRNVGFDLPSNTASHHRQSNIQIVTWLYDKSLEMRRRRTMEKISWPDRVRTEEVLHGVKKERNILHTVIRRKANGIGHILRWNCLLEHVIERR
jgi:hypothetical protein